MKIIKKISEITEVQMVVEASTRDAFSGTVLQSGTLPHVFSYGERRTMKHPCARCQQEVTVEFAFGRQILAGGTLSRQGFHENRGLLDAVGNLFGQYLHHEIDLNGFESYLYLNAPGNNGALLDVAYYRCSHCQAQYLVLHREWLKDERPPFEPDELSIKQIYQVVFDHEAFLRSFHRLEHSAVS